jgi:molybdopterin-guanine dinucleotide biosynthesis protein A
MRPYAAIVLAGGRGDRLGGADKAAIEVGGASLFQRATAAVHGAHVTVAVGPTRRVPDGVITVEEEPRGGGPVAAIAAGLDAVARDAAADIVVVLACDMPLVDSAAVERLVRTLAESADADAAMYVDDGGRRQFLAAAYRRVAVADAIAALPSIDGASMRALVDGLTVAEIAAHPELTLDCDTWEDVERTRQILEDK